VGFYKRLAGLALFGAAAMAAQAPGVAHMQAPKSISAKAHAQVTTIMHVSIDAGFHIQSDHPKLDYLIPSTIAVAPAAGIHVVKVAWPQATDHRFSFAPDPLPVFEGILAIPVTLATGAPGTTVLHGSFRYQACNDELCRPPVTEQFTLTVAVR